MSDLRGRRLSRLERIGTRARRSRGKTYVNSLITRWIDNWLLIEEPAAVVTAQPLEWLPIADASFEIPDPSAWTWVRRGRWAS